MLEVDLGYTVEFHKPSFCKWPEGLNAINVAFPSDKFINTMSYTIMLFISQVNQAVITAPIIWMYNAIRFYFASDNGLLINVNYYFSLTTIIFPVSSC